MSCSVTWLSFSKGECWTGPNPVFFVSWLLEFLGNFFTGTEISNKVKCRYTIVFPDFTPDEKN